MPSELAVGTRVETIKPDKESSDWEPAAKLLRKWGVSGVVLQTKGGHGTVHEVKHADGTSGWYEPRELKALDVMSYIPEDRAKMLRGMRDLSDLYYSHAVRLGVHAFIEFAGLMNEFIRVCEEAHARGQNFPFSNTHSGEALPFKSYHLSYLAEKLECIYGPALLAKAENRDAFIWRLFEGAYRLVPTNVPAETEMPDFEPLLSEL